LIIILAVIFVVRLFFSFEWMVNDGLFSSPAKVNIFLVVTLVTVGTLLIMGFFLLSRDKDSGGGERAQWDGDGEPFGAVSFDEMIGSLNSSLDNLKALKAKLHEQTEALARLNYELSRSGFSKTVKTEDSALVPVDLSEKRLDFYRLRYYRPMNDFEITAVYLNYIQSRQN
jgi:hypothetical protein